MVLPFHHNLDPVLLTAQPTCPTLHPSAELVAAAAGTPLTRVEPEWPAFKAQTLFGQLPMLELPGGAKVCQSAAIVRVLARRGGLEGKSEADFVLSEMLTEEFGDLLTALGKAMYPNPPANDQRPSAMAALFAPEGAAAKHLRHFEGLLSATGAFTSAPTSGELAVVAACHLLKELEPACLEAVPKLKAFFEGPREESAAKVLAGLGQYYQRTVTAAE